MTPYVALLRAVNVGGTGVLTMADLRVLAERCGHRRVRTHLASGNLVFETGDDEDSVKTGLERALAVHMGKPVDVKLRSGPALAAVLAANPFPQADPNRTVAIFLDAPPPADTLDRVTGAAREELALGLREIWVHYPDGQGRSTLRIPEAAAGTARNLNTIAALVRMVAGTVPR
jgi:uncharacterized protein (DUF1697 family)